MFNLLALILICTFDIPLLEDYPALWVAVARAQLLKTLPDDISVASYLELYQCTHERAYYWCLVIYEFYLCAFIVNAYHHPYSKIYQNIYTILVLTCFCFYNWSFNAFFILASCFLPVFFYYFFVLTDYLEAIEELLAYIWSVI